MALWLIVRIEATREFLEWKEHQTAKAQAQVDARVDRIRVSGYFGDAKDLGSGLAELRWKNGRRVYFSKMRAEDGAIVLLILEGNKNGQSQDIKKAKFLLQKYERDSNE